MGNNNAFRINSAFTFCCWDKWNAFPFPLWLASILPPSFDGQFYADIWRDEMRHHGQPSQIYIYSHDHLRVIKIDKLTRVNKLPATIYITVFCVKDWHGIPAIPHPSSLSRLFMMTRFNWSCEVKKIHLINPLLSGCESHLHVFTI